MDGKTEKIFETFRKVRPKYSQDVVAFIREDFVPIMRAIEARNWVALDVVYRSAVNFPDAYHAKFNKWFVRFRLPERPPEWFDPGPQQPFAQN
jgi:hypothetical protein